MQPFSVTEERAKGSVLLGSSHIIRRFTKFSKYTCRPFVTRRFVRTWEGTGWNLTLLTGEGQLPSSFNFFFILFKTDKKKKKKKIKDKTKRYQLT